VSYRDEKDALRAERDQLEQALAERDEQLRKLEKKLKRARRKAAHSAHADAESDAPSDPPATRRIAASGIGMWKALVPVALFAVYLGAGAGSLAVGLVVGLILLISMYQILGGPRAQLELSPEGIWVISKERRSGYAWDSIDNVVIVERSGSVRLKVQRNDRWEFLPHTWSIGSEEVSTALCDWIAFTRGPSQLRPAVPRTRVRVEAEPPFDDAEELAESVEEPERASRNRAER
jgi:hypothetical protein